MVDVLSQKPRRCHQLVIVAGRNTGVSAYLTVGVFAHTEVHICFAVDNELRSVIKGYHLYIGNICEVVCFGFALPLDFKCQLLEGSTFFHLGLLLPKSYVLPRILS